MGVSWGFHKWGYPKIDGFCEGKPHLEMDDWGVPLFMETPISTADFFSANPNCLNLGVPFGNSRDSQEESAHILFDDFS